MNYGSGLRENGLLGTERITGNQVNEMHEDKIFCLGFPRTGTSSLHRAFETLEIKSVHAPFGLWKAPMGMQIQEFQAFVDLPIPLFYDTYAREFPSARFILTVREEEPWLSSMQWLFRNGPRIWNFAGSGWERGGIVERIHQSMYGTAVFDREKLRSAYRSHNQRVRDYFALSPRFLSIRVERDMKYDVLCRFLQMPVVNNGGPLPRENRRRSPRASLPRRVANRLLRIFYTDK